MRFCQTTYNQHITHFRPLGSRGEFYVNYSLLDRWEKHISRAARKAPRSGWLKRAAPLITDCCRRAGKRKDCLPVGLRSLRFPAFPSTSATAEGNDGRKHPGILAFRGTQGRRQAHFPGLLSFSKHSGKTPGALGAFIALVESLPPAGNNYRTGGLYARTTAEGATLGRVSEGAFPE